MSKPYNVDEKIRVVQGGSVIAEGIVKDITIRHTVIRQFNGESCIVPNSVMDAAVITNTNFTENIGNFLEIEIAYDSDIKGAMQVYTKWGYFENDGVDGNAGRQLFGVQRYTQRAGGSVPKEWDPDSLSDCGSSKYCKL